MTTTTHSHQPWTSEGGHVSPASRDELHRGIADAGERQARS